MADQSRQTHGAEIDERHAEPAAEHAEHGIVGRDAQIAPERKLEATCDCMTLDGRNYRLAEKHARRAHRSVCVGRQVSFVAPSKSFEVGARAKETSCSGQHGDVRFSVLVEAAERLGKRVGSRSIDRVAHLRPVDRHDGDAITKLVEDTHVQLLR